MAVLPKSPGYIRKWLANTESAEVPLCAQAIIGEPQTPKKTFPRFLQVLLGNLEGTAQPKCQKDTANAESLLKALPMLFSAEVLNYFEFLGMFFSVKSQPVGFFFLIPTCWLAT